MNSATVIGPPRNWKIFERERRDLTGESVRSGAFFFEGNETSKRISLSLFSHTRIRALMCLVMGVSMGGGKGKDAACELEAEVIAGVAAAVARSAAEVDPSVSSPRPWLPPPTNPVLSIVISCQPDPEGDEGSAWALPSPSLEPLSFEEEEEEAKKRRRRRSSSPIRR